jgi:hypothetical protein
MNPVTIINQFSASRCDFASGKAPSSFAKYLDGGILTALKKGKPDLPNVRPIVVGEL